jgi:hypothetical protein
MTSQARRAGIGRGVGARVFPTRQPDGGTKIDQGDDIIGVVPQNVGGLDVAVDDILLVDVGKNLAQFFNPKFNPPWLHA